MLDVEPSKRPSAANILKHPWMTCLNPPSTQLVVTSEAHHLKVWPFFYSYCCWQQFVPSAHSELKFRRKECENFTLPIYFQKSEEVAGISARKLLLRRRQFAYLIRFLTSLCRLLKSYLFQNQHRHRFSICFPPTFEFKNSNCARKRL